MLTDFGLNFQEVLNKSTIDHDDDGAIKLVKNKVDDISNNFDLILLADGDYFDDSIILLKNALCWTFEDMIHLKLNSHVERSVPQSNMSDWGRKIITGML